MLYNKYYDIFVIGAVHMNKTISPDLEFEIALERSNYNTMSLHGIKKRRTWN